MANILIIGAGGVSRVATIKCAKNSEIFTKITLASRTKSKCDEIAKFIKERVGVCIDTAQIDADDTEAVVKLIKFISLYLKFVKQYTVTNRSRREITQKRFQKHYTSVTKRLPTGVRQPCHTFVTSLSHVRQDQALTLHRKPVKQRY